MKKDRKKRTEGEKSQEKPELYFSISYLRSSSSFPTQTDNQISMTGPEKLDADVCAQLAADSSSFQKLKRKNSLFSLQCFFFFSSTFSVSELQLDSPSALARFLIGRGHPGSEAAIGCRGILLESSEF